MSPINLMLSHKLRLNPFKGGGKSFCCSIILKDITVPPNGNVAMHVKKLKAEEQRTHRCLCGMEANFNTPAPLHSNMKDHTLTP